jgi:hypothetical protein
MASSDSATIAAWRYGRRLVAVLPQGVNRRRLNALGLRRRLWLSRRGWLRCWLVGFAHFCTLGLTGGLVGSLPFGGGAWPLSFLRGELGDFGSFGIRWIV